MSWVGDLESGWLQSLMACDELGFLILLGLKPSFRVFGCLARVRGYRTQRRAKTMKERSGNQRHLDERS